MRKFRLSDAALAAVQNTSSAQVWFFVLSSRRADAVALEAHICLDKARRRARTVKGIAKAGRVELTDSGAFAAT
jgi:hypothetical protein